MNVGDLFHHDNSDMYGSCLEVVVISTKPLIVMTTDCSSAWKAYKTHLHSSVGCTRGGYYWTFPASGVVWGGGSAVSSGVSPILTGSKVISSGSYWTSSIPYFIPAKKFTSGR